MADKEKADKEKLVNGKPCSDTRNQEQADLPSAAVREEDGDLRSELSGDDYSLPLSFYTQKPANPGAEVDEGERGISADSPAPVLRPGVGALTEAAFMVALMLALSAIAIYMPFLSAAAPFFLPLPMAILAFRRGLSVSLIAILCAAILLTLWFGFPGGILLAAYGGVGVFFGICLKSGVKPFIILLSGAVISALITVAQMALVLDTAAGVSLSSQIYSLSDGLMDVYRESGLLEQLRPAGVSAEAFETYLKGIIAVYLPASLVLASMVVSGITYGILTGVLRRMGGGIPALPRFRQWRVPWQYIWVAILGAACYLTGLWLQNDAVMAAGVNILYISAIILFAIGLSFAVWLLGYARVSVVFIVMLVLFLMIFGLMSPFIMLLVLTGLADPFLDFRARIIKASESRRNRS